MNDDRWLRNHLLCRDGKFPSCASSSDGVVHYFAQASVISSCNKRHWVQCTPLEGYVTCLECSRLRYE